MAFMFPANHINRKWREKYVRALGIIWMMSNFWKAQFKKKNKRHSKEHEGFSSYLHVLVSWQ